jgi:hypothetical protein
MIRGTTMLMKTCIAAAVALGCVLAAPGASFAQDTDKSPTASPDKSKALPTKPHPKKKGHSYDIHTRVYPSTSFAQEKDKATASPDKSKARATKPHKKPKKKKGYAGPPEVESR